MPMGGTTARARLAGDASRRPRGAGSAPPRFGLGPRIRANVDTAVRQRTTTATEATRDRNRGDRGVRGVGLLLTARRRARGEGRYAIRSAVRLGLPGRGRGPQGRLPAAPRSTP